MMHPRKGEFFSSRVRYISLNQIRPNPQQPRRRFDPESLQELAASIAAYGILQPLTVRQQGAVYELVAGERRWRAARIAGLRQVPCLLARVDEAMQNATSAADALEAVFMAHVHFVSEHPGVPRMFFGELQRPGNTLPKKMVQTLARHYGERLHRLLEAGKSQGELDPNLDVDAASALFLGSIQGLVMQSLLAGDTTQIRRDAPGVFSIYRRGIRSAL